MTRPPILKFVFMAALVFVVSSCQQACKTEFTWQYSNSREVRYSLNVEKGLMNGAPERTESHTLKLKFLGNNNVEVSLNDTATGSFSLSSGGDLELASASQVPSYWSIILLMTLPPNGIRASSGDSWETFYPGQAQIAQEAGRVAMQDRFNVTVQNIQGNVGDLSIEGSTKIVRNAFTESLLADTAGTLQSVYNWTMFMTGTGTYDVNEKRINSLDAYVMLFPQIGSTADTLRQSRHRQHVTFTHIP